VKGP